MFDHSSSMYVGTEEKVDVNPFVGWAIHYEAAFGKVLGCSNFSWGQDFKNLLEFAEDEGFVCVKKFKAERVHFSKTVAILEKKMPFGKIVCLVADDLPVKCNILLGGGGATNE